MIWCIFLLSLITIIAQNQYVSGTKVIYDRADVVTWAPLYLIQSLYFIKISCAWDGLHVCKNTSECNQSVSIVPLTCNNLTSSENTINSGLNSMMTLHICRYHYYTMAGYGKDHTIFNTLTAIQKTFYVAHDGTKYQFHIRNHCP